MSIDDKSLDDLFATELTPEAPKKEEGTLTLVSEKDRSLKIAFVGVGQAGSKIVQECYELGYSVGIINTALQDLKFVGVPERKKLFLDFGLGGAGKDLAIGQGAVEKHREAIVKFLDAEVVSDAEMLFLVISGGGGTGSGSTQPMIDILASFGRPVGVIYALPMNTDDALAKKNALTTLAKLARMASTDVISTLIVVDNSKIEQIYGHLGQAGFWKAANKAIIEPFHMFNSLTSQPSAFTSLDPSDFGKVLTYGDCSLYGAIQVDNYEEETALAEAVLNGLEAGMLASGFDLKTSKIGGVLVVGRKDVLDKVPTNNLNYMFHILGEKTDNASLYRGIYAMDSAGDGLRVFSWFAGLGLPVDRINTLKAESVILAAKQEEKEKSRATTMALDLGGDKSTTAAAEIHAKIKAKNSGFGKLTGGIVDKRKK